MSLDAALALPSGPGRRKTVVAAVRALAARDPDAALGRVEEELEGTERAAAMQAGLAVWAAIDPRAAGEWVLGMRADPAFESTLAGFARSWAGLSPAAAAEWVSDLPADEANASAADAVASEWVESDAMAAYEWALEHYEKTEEGIAFQRAIAALAVEDPALALAALGDAPSDLQYRGHSQIASQWASTDPAAAATWAESLPPGRNQNAALGNVVDVWSREAPSQAADYLVGLGDFSGQENAAAFLINNWADSDAVAASEWLAGLPDGGLRDDAISGFTYTLQFSDPAAAVTWGLDISNPELRSGRVEELLFDWYDREPQAARQYMDSAPVPEEIKRNVLEL